MRLFFADREPVLAGVSSITLPTSPTVSRTVVQEVVSDTGIAYLVGLDRRLRNVRLIALILEEDLRWIWVVSGQNR